MGVGAGGWGWGWVNLKRKKLLISPPKLELKQDSSMLYPTAKLMKVLKIKI